MSANQPSGDLNNHHFVTVTFVARRSNQAQADAEIGDYVASFLSQQPRSTA